jgi:hypothetical protein
MTRDVQQLVLEAIDLTGAAAPSLLDDDAPTLSTDQHESFYFIGLVGGKDVGKSSLVNALVGKPITQPTSYGPGTQSVIAYAHESATDDVRRLLQREVADRFSIVTHHIDQLRRQVLLDLPDIDSKYDDHVQITRRMLRHMLYPLWIQSVEKYADLRPQELLAAVSEGNDPANFVFCLNKADYLKPSESAELREDYARRIERALKLPASPQVYLISAARPADFDLPGLRQHLAREKPLDTVKSALNLAERRQDRSLLRWLGQQRLSERAQQLARLEQDADELTAERIGVPILQRAIPGLLDDPGQRMALTGPAVRQRMSRWPIVNALDVLLSPLVSLVQRNLSATGPGPADPDAYLDIKTSELLQTTFAQLHQLHPELSELYRDRKLWEVMPADTAATDLRRRFGDAMTRLREATVARSSSALDVLLAPFRWLLTIGAALWFPFVQPVLAIVLQQDAWGMSKQTFRVIVEMLSVSHLLQCALFLLIWFTVLWAGIRILTARRVGRRIERWKTAGPDDELSLAGQTTQWINDLLEPIRRRRQRVESLCTRADQLSSQLGLTQT